MRKLLQFLLILSLGVFCCECVNTFAVQELNQKAFDYMENGNMEAAISRFEASIDLDGEIYETRYNIGTAYINIGKCQEAIPHLEKATTLKPKEPIAFYSLGVAAECAAKKIYETKDENGRKIEKTYTNPREAKIAKESYVKNLNILIEAFENYLKIVPNAEDALRISDIIKETQKKLDDIDKE
jgi:tetratricopeptide (TPR) repeat protein